MKKGIDPLKDLGYDGFERTDEITLPVKLAQQLASPEWKDGKKTCKLISILVVKGCDLDEKYNLDPRKYAIFHKIAVSQKKQKPGKDEEVLFHKSRLPLFILSLALIFIFCYIDFNMLKIRLQRIGKRNAPSYRVVLVEHTTKPQGNYIELLGFYNPKSKQKTFKKERIDYWIAKGAQASPTVHNLLVDEKIVKGKKARAWRPKKKKEAKPQPTAEQPQAGAEAKEKKPAEEKTEKSKEVPKEEKKEEEKPIEEEKKGPKQEEKVEEGVDPSPNLPEKDTIEDKSAEK